METVSREIIVNECLCCIHDKEFSYSEKQFIVTQLMSYLEHLYKGDDVVCNCLLVCLDDYISVVNYKHHEE